MHRIIKIYYAHRPNTHHVVESTLVLSKKKSKGILFYCHIKLSMYIQKNFFFYIAYFVFFYNLASAATSESNNSFKSLAASSRHCLKW
jgi:hypothetical protein